MTYLRSSKEVIDGSSRSDETDLRRQSQTPIQGGLGWREAKIMCANFKAKQGIKSLNSRGNLTL